MPASGLPDASDGKLVISHAQDPGLSPATLFSSVFFNQLAANLKNATNLLNQLRNENASLVTSTAGPREHAQFSYTQVYTG